MVLSRGARETIIHVSHGARSGLRSMGLYSYMVKTYLVIQISRLQGPILRAHGLDCREMTVLISHPGLASVGLLDVSPGLVLCLPWPRQLGLCAIPSTP